MHNDGHCHKSHCHQMKEKIETHHSISSKHSNHNFDDENENKIADERANHDDGKHVFYSHHFSTQHTLADDSLKDRLRRGRWK